jgi:uncharacterized repeat protein (TIGR03803 family)
VAQPYKAAYPPEVLFWTQRETSTARCSRVEPAGLGTVYELVAPVGKGKYQDSVLWNFNGTDGSSPRGGVVLDSAGNLYGVTYEGGSLNGGVVYEITP